MSSDFLDMTLRQAKRELARRKIYHSFGSFFKAYEPNPNYIFGDHTKRLIYELDKTTKLLEKGTSRNLCFCLPFRHGKSDVSSRRWGVWHLLRNPRHKIILASYNKTMAEGFSYDARSCFREAGVHYNLRINKDRSAVGDWRIDEHGGRFYAVGIDGTITGRGGNLIIIDDYIKGREEAESKKIRDNVWDSFRSDLWTRRTPVCSVVIVANRWHKDDLVGRIKDKNDPKSRKYDPNFAKFEMINIPAQYPDGRWLFPEMFSDQWYRETKAVMGSYAWSAMGLQIPVMRGGNLFKMNVVYVDEFPEGLSWNRGWDVASSEKQLMKSDPDFTVGTKSAVKDNNLYIADVKFGQWQAPERNRIMIDTGKRDGPSVPIIIETIGGYKDCYTTIQQDLAGLCSVRNFIPKTDKVARASIIEPFFEAGHVFVKRAYWNERWFSEFESFPDSDHDDFVDSLVTSAYDSVYSMGAMGLSR